MAVQHCAIFKTRRNCSTNYRAEQPSGPQQLLWQITRNVKKQGKRSILQLGNFSFSRCLLGRRCLFSSLQKNGRRKRNNVVLFLEIIESLVSGIFRGGQKRLERVKFLLLRIFVIEKKQNLQNFKFCQSFRQRKKSKETPDFLGTRWNSSGCLSLLERKGIRMLRFLEICRIRQFC